MTCQAEILCTLGLLIRGKVCETLPVHTGSNMLTRRAARLVLNYKNIEYVTMWTEYPEIAPTFKNVYVCSQELPQPPLVC